MTGRLAIPELFAPLPIAALAVMAVNDEWLKPKLHNALTGKLSDVAVCIVLPLFVAAVLGVAAPAISRRIRLLIGSLATASLFTALELSPATIRAFCAANDQVARWMGIPGTCQLTPDLTDLLALALVPLAYLYGMKRPHHGPEPAAQKLAPTPIRA